MDTTLDVHSNTRWINHLNKSVQFYTKSGGTYLWGFGDGDASVDSAPLHTYADVGHYDVSLHAVVGAESTTVSYPDYICYKQDINPYVDFSRNGSVVAIDDILDVTSTPVSAMPLFELLPNNVVAINTSDPRYKDGSIWGRNYQIIYHHSPALFSIKDTLLNNDADYGESDISVCRGTEVPVDVEIDAVVSADQIYMSELIESTIITNIFKTNFSYSSPVTSSRVYALRTLLENNYTDDILRLGAVITSDMVTSVVMDLDDVITINSCLIWRSGESVTDANAVSMTMKEFPIAGNISVRVTSVGGSNG